MPVFLSCFLTIFDADDDLAHQGRNDSEATDAGTARSQIRGAGVPDRPCFLCRCGRGAADPPSDFRMSRREILAARGPSASTVTTPHVMESASLADTNMLILRCEYDRATGGDVHGAFRPEGYRCACWLKSVLPTVITRTNAPSPYVVVVNNGFRDEHPPRTMRAQTLKAFQQRIDNGAPRLEFVAFLGHGEPHWMQFGFSVPHAGSTADTLGDLVSLMHQTCANDVRIAIYGCSAGASPGSGREGENDHEGIDGLADRLRTQLVAAGTTGVQIDAHQTVAHTTRNPRIRRFTGTGTGGTWIVRPRSTPHARDPLEHRVGRALWDRWSHAIHHDDMRFRAPFMTAAEIDAYLRDDTHFTGTLARPLPTV